MAMASDPDFLPSLRKGQISDLRSGKAWVQNLLFTQVTLQAWNPQQNLCSHYGASGPTLLTLA